MDNTNNIIRQVDTQGTLAGRIVFSKNLVIDAFINSRQCSVSSRKTYRFALERFFCWLEETGRELSQLTRNDIVAYYNRVMGKEDKNNPEFSQIKTGANLTLRTAALYLVAVRLFFEWAESEKMYPNIAKGIKGPKRSSSQKGFLKKPLQNGQPDRLLSYASEYHPLSENKQLEGSVVLKRENTYSFKDEIAARNFAMLNLMLRCGLRTIEVSRALVGDIVLENSEDGEIRILRIQGKGHEEKDDYVVLYNDAYEPIRKYLEFRPGHLVNEPLFPTLSNGRPGHPMSTRQIQSICKEALRGIGLDSHEYSAHSLRHTTGTAIVDLGGGVLDVQLALRHANPATSEIYIRQAMERKKKMNSPLKMLEGHFKKPEEQ